MSLQFDESTDVAGCAQVVAFVRFDSNEKLMEEILFCKAFPINTSDRCWHDMFLEATQDVYIDWAQKCIAICNDGARLKKKAKGLLDALLSPSPSFCSQNLAARLQSSSKQYY